MKNDTATAPPKTYQLRYCTGGCKNNPHHHPHVYTVDPVDGDLGRAVLCPGNSGPRVREWLDPEDGEPTGFGFIES